MKDIKVVDSALFGVAYLLRAKHEVYFSRRDVGFLGHSVFSPPVTRYDIPMYYSIFKREFFMSFNKQFPQFVKENPEFSGVGESVNKEVLYSSISRNVDYLLFVYESGKVYKVSPKIVRNFCQKHNLVRTQDKVNSFKRTNGSGGVTTVRESTYSFPIALMERMGDV